APMPSASVTITVIASPLTRVSDRSAKRKSVMMLMILKSNGGLRDRHCAASYPENIAKSRRWFDLGRWPRERSEGRKVGRPEGAKAGRLLYRYRAASEDVVG